MCCYELKCFYLKQDEQNTYVKFGAQDQGVGLLIMHLKKSVKFPSQSQSASIFVAITSFFQICYYRFGACIMKH